jgi:type IV secretory pathway VirB3-like protein
MLKHTLYQTIARPTTIWGIPRIALMVSVVISIIPFPILSLVIDQMIAFLISVSIFALSWIIMKVISYNDPDAILTIATKLRNLKEGGRYAA